MHATPFIVECRGKKLYGGKRKFEKREIENNRCRGISTCYTIF